ncbi:MAG: methyltransferase domain-containing protein [Actinomycetota bacterium]|nr:methyltransferase domain-containing protein [Actinomycetota bacterium]MDA3037448.1 methyltransferase domain-containing protein [Actinomycetota bacterium]
MDEYKLELFRQRENILNNSGLRSYFSFLYEIVNQELEKFDSILEVGAGAAISEIFLKQRMVRTDILPFNEFDVMGHCSMENLPFKESQFDAVLAFDSIHHLEKPSKAILELLRVTREGGKIILVEPFVSPLSYLPYKMFHHEDTSWDFREKGSIELSLRNLNPEMGDQGVSRFIINQLSNWRTTNLPKLTVSTTYLSPFSFYATGGVSRPLNTPKIFVNSLIQVEKLIPNFIMKFLASRVILTITK